MESSHKSLLLDFYFGVVNESQRLAIEKDLLVDTEMLLDYLDLKREIENATQVPQKASPFLWRRLNPPTARKVWYLTTAAALAVAGCALYLRFQTPSLEPSLAISDKNILFDSNAEHSLAADVL